MVEHVIVTLVALGGAFVVGRQLIGAFAEKPKGPPCASCPSSAKARPVPRG